MFMTDSTLKTIFYMGVALWTTSGMNISLEAPAHSKKLTALRTPAATKSLILADIDSMLNVNTYRDADPVTWGHETCHGIASRIRQIEGANTNGFYCLGGNYIVLKEPKFTLKALAALIPKEHRGVIYQLYLVDQQRYWNEQPAYILDESFAYLNGTLVGLELEDSQPYTTRYAMFGERPKALERYPRPLPYAGPSRIEATYVRSIEACVYSMYLMNACPAYDLRCAVAVLLARNLAIYQAIEGSPFMTAAVKEACEKLVAVGNG